MKKYKSLILKVAIVTMLSSSLFSAKSLGVVNTKNNTQVNVQSILNHVKYLSSDSEFKALKYRVAGMAGEKKAAKYIEEAFKKSGLEVKQQKFDYDEVVKENSNIVKFSYKNGAEINTILSKIVSAENIDKTIQGKLIDLGNGTKKDFESKKNKIKGNFILIKANELISMDYVAYMEFSKEAKGIIIYDPSFNLPKGPVVLNQFTMPKSNIIGEKCMFESMISKGDYENLVKELSNKQEINISAYVKYNREKLKRSSQNVVATKYCDKIASNKPLIVIGAHYDCENNPGAVDNAVGAAALIELGRIISNNKLNYDIKLVAFGAEEVGIFGSSYFVSSLSKNDLKRCKLMINIEGGVGDVLIIGKNTGEADSHVARNLAFKVAEKNNILYRKFEFSASDQFYFSQIGIPTITFANMSYLNKNNKSKIKTIDPNYHTFDELAKENIIDQVEECTYDKVEKSNKANSNFKKLFTVLLGVLENYKI